MKLIDIVIREMKLPKNYAPTLTCGELETLIMKHARDDTKLKFVIEIYEIKKETHNKTEPPKSEIRKQYPKTGV